MTATEKPENKKKKIWKYLLNALLLLVLLTLFIPSWRREFQSWFTIWTLAEVEFTQDDSSPLPQEQRNWELFSADGRLHNFANFEGKPIVVQFWATWCTYCKAAFPDLGELRENFNNEIVFVAPTLESVDVLNESGYAEDYDFLYSTQTYPEHFQVKAYPTLVILDKEMNVVYTMEGAGDINNEKNIQFLKGLL